MFNIFVLDVGGFNDVLGIGGVNNVFGVGGFNDGFVIWWVRQYLRLRRVRR